MKPVLPLAVLALALTGCASVDRAPPATAVTLPPAFILGEGERAAAADLAALLPQGDAAFAELNRRALESAPTLGAALARIDAARAGLRGAGASLAPSIDAAGSVSRNEGNAAQFGGAPIPDTGQTRYSLGLSASWDVDLFGRLPASRDAAAARLDAASADADAVRLSLSSDIAVAVIDWRTLAAREAVARQDAASAAELVDLTGVRARAGLVPGFDLVRAQSLAADAAARIEPFAAQRAEVIGRLVRLTALAPAEIVTLLDGSPGAPATARSLSVVPSALLRSRPDVVAAERRLAAADAEIAAAAADRFPRLSISGTLGLFSLGFSSLFEEEALIGSLGAGLAGPLLDFGRVGARIDARQADARAAFETYRGTVFQALGETEAAMGSIAALDARAATLERQATIDADAAGLARQRYRLGLDPLLTVLDAERTLNASRSNALAARGDAARARVALYRAVGGPSR